MSLEQIFSIECRREQCLAAPLVAVLQLSERQPQPAGSWLVCWAAEHAESSGKKYGSDCSRHAI